MKEVLTVSNLDLSHYISYKDIEVDHTLCPCVIIKRVSNTRRGDQDFKCYGWTESNNVITSIHNNFDNTSRLEVNFTAPILEETPIMDRDQNGNKRTK